MAMPTILSVMLIIALIFFISVLQKEEKQVSQESKVR